MPTKTVLFDLDGTLLDSERDFTQVLNDQLTRDGLTPVNSLQVRNSVSSGASALIKLGYNIDESNSNFASYLEEFLNSYESCISNTKCVMFPGISALLSALNKMDSAWGIVTNKPSRFALPLIEKFPALRNCDVVICSDQLKNSKPDPEGILRACKLMNVSPHDTLYVGDHPKDIQAAKAAGVTSIAVRWGYIPDDSPIEDWQADLIIKHPAEILDQAVQ